MRIPLRWLREFVDISMGAEEIAHRLTMSGTEVGSIARVGSDWDRAVIGRIDELGKHEGADNLFVARVDVGEERLTLVTAALNLAQGDVVPVVRAAGRLAADRVIGARRFRGIRSEGMLCSGHELGISPDADTIYVLEPEAPIGVDLREYLGDHILDIELTPNRPDCLGVLGIAREIAAVTGARLRVPEEDLPPSNPGVGANPVRVFVDDGDLCPRYTAAYVDGLRVASSPPWLQRRLFHSGIRAINNVVDVTNYVMLELGQPLHAFDADQLRDQTIRVRRARPGERITTIDGVDRDLPPDALLIADAEVPVGIAGIMGGITSEISASTTRVVLESANFDATSIRRTSRHLRLVTEASKRFDKRLDVELPPLASRRAVAMFLQLAGGAAPAELVDIRQGSTEPRVIRFAASDIGGLVGQPYPAEQIIDVLGSLGFEVNPDGAALEARVPSWRGDVEGKADVAEEVARIVGYDAIPAVLPDGALPPPADDPALHWVDALRTRLASVGLQEVMTYSLVDAHAVSRLDARSPFPPGGPDDGLIPVSNPMTVEHSRLRASLVPSLLDTVAANLRFQRRVAIFELARVFLSPLSPLPREERRLAIALAGRRTPEVWNTDPVGFDFYDLSAATEAVFECLHLPYSIVPSSDAPWTHPGRAAVVRVEGDPRDVAVIGQVHPIVAARFGIDSAEVYAAEIQVEALLSVAREQTPLHPLPRYPAVERDLALLVDEGTSYEQVADVIRSAAGALLDGLRLFDVYRGPPVPVGHVSLAFSLAFRSPARTLADEEVTSVMDAVERAAKTRLGAAVRGR